MSSQRFTPEFKEEAVRQVLDRGYSVAEISARLGVSTHSLYKWVKAVTPDKTEKQIADCLKPRVRYCVCGRKCVVWKKSATS